RGPYSQKGSRFYRKAKWEIRRARSEAPRDLSKRSKKSKTRKYEDYNKTTLFIKKINLLFLF
ncbi:MAG: hypothetical protein ACFFA8_06905, partial [Promethearchaeota archaeon]